MVIKSKRYKCVYNKKKNYPYIDSRGIMEKNIKIYNIEKLYLSQLQGKLHKTLNNIKKMDSEINTTQLITIMYINNQIDAILNDLDNLNMSILDNRKDIKSDKKSYNYLKELKENDKIFNTLVPLAILLKMKNYD